MSLDQPIESTDGERIDSDVFRAIANYTYDWESWHSPDGKLMWVNAAVERMTGYLPAECLRMPDYPLAIVAKGDHDKIAEVFCSARDGGSGNDVEFQIAHRDGSAHWGAVSWQPIYDSLGSRLGYRASIRDVSERQQLREELRLHNQHLEQLVQERTARIAQLEEHRQKMEKLAALGQMAAGVAHEVNNPLAGIRNAFTLFKGNLSPGDENYELLELIDSEIERISSITHRMYQLYRPSQQAPCKFDLRPTISSTMVLTDIVARESGVKVQMTIGDCVSDATLNGTEVVLREGELKQVLLNVIRNAIQASPPGTTVQVTLSTSAADASIAVVDQGGGISESVAARLFEPFYSTKSGAREGMGLGLSVSRSLVEAMGGTIAIDNNEATSGACALLTLPRRMPTDE